jgi:site-specific recombinase XerD
MTIHIESGSCVVSGQTVYALYDGAFPVVAATIYLQHLSVNCHLAPNTSASYAYALKAFFEFLKRNNITFWEITQATIKSYKRFHLDRRDKHGVFTIKRVTARQNLTALKQFIGYWRGLSDNDSLFVDEVAEVDGRRHRDRRRGALAHISWYSRVPSSLWQVKVPRSESRDKRRYKGLSGEDCRLVMGVLNRAEHRTDIQRMLYYRDRAIWAFMLMSLMRKGEVVRTRLDDLDRRRGIIYLRDRPEDRWLGDLKSGPGEIFVTTNNPYWSFVNSWLTEGRWIAVRLLEERGLPDHGLFLCNRDGGPLTQPAIDHLFKRLKAACKFGRNKFFSPTSRATQWLA